jgi:CheY-like chemotaxis protein
MGQLGTTDVIDRDWGNATFDDRTVPVNNSILVVRDAGRNSDYLNSVCEFLGIAMQYVSAGEDLQTILPGLRPMAVVADLDGDVQDGFHVMKMTADFDRSVPILLLTSSDPALLGAIDAVQEAWGLTHVATAADTAGIGVFVDFICQAARDAGRPRLMRV